MRMDRQTDITKLIVAIRNSAKGPNDKRMKQKKLHNSSGCMATSSAVHTILLSRILATAL
jgi:hypothetical protein